MRQIFVAKEQGCSERRRDQNYSHSVTHNGRFRPRSKSRNVPRGHTLSHHALRMEALERLCPRNTAKRLHAGVIVLHA